MNDAMAAAVAAVNLSSLLRPIMSISGPGTLHNIQTTIATTPPLYQG
jgi:hypothetical protein